MQKVHSWLLWGLPRYLLCIVVVLFLSACGLPLDGRSAHITSALTTHKQETQNQRASKQLVQTKPVQMNRLDERIEPPILASPMSLDNLVEAQAINSWLAHAPTRAELLIWITGLLIWRTISRRRYAYRLWHETQQKMQHAVQGILESQRYFHALLAHELRGPVASLQLQAAHLEALPLASRAQVHVRRMRQGVRRMSALLEQLLSLSRAHIQSPTIQEINEPTSVQKAFREVLEDLMPQIQRRQQDLELIHDVEVYAHISTFDLNTLLRNLLDNASRYTPNGGSIKVSLQTLSDGVLIQVADNGSGIPEENLSRVFDPFYRIQKNPDGIGLGLSIVQMLARRWQGDVTLRNRSSGGLVASLWLPARHVERAQKLGVSKHEV